MIKIEMRPQNDPQFLELVTSVLNGAVACYQPEEIYVVQIDGCFDHKWLHFSGVFRYLGIWGSPLRLPPFHPNRVIEQVYLRRKKSGQSGYSPGDANPLHIKQHSWDNMHRRLDRLAQSCLYLWFSGNNSQSDKSSILLYNVSKEGRLAWYASFTKMDNWQLNKVKSISKQEFEALINMPGAIPSRLTLSVKRA